jgi:dipeptidyl aminopeptidase/acylaminoacyl peptidase
MGVTGGSYGGYLTNWVISQTPRFKAAVSMYGIFSWFTDWSNSFQPAFEQMYFGYNYWDRPLDMNNLYIARAPQSYVKNIVTPTLILQGTEDSYTNISNSREMYQALKELGRTVEFVTYQGEGHGLRNKPNNYINSVERASAWFDRYVRGMK